MKNSLKETLYCEDKVDTVMWIKDINPSKQKLALSISS